MRMLFRLCAYIALGLLYLSVASVSADDKDKNDQKSKQGNAMLVPFTWAEGEILNVNEDSEKLTLRVKQLSQVVVNNGGQGVMGAINRATVYGRLGAANPNSATLGVKEDIKDYPIYFAPDMKVRLMNTKQDTSKDKNSAKKDAKEKDPDAKLGGAPGKKESLAKGQMVRIQVGRSKDSINQQNYAMVIYVVSEGK
jgi:hypothetical protein